MTDQADTLCKAYGASRTLPAPWSGRSGASTAQRAPADPAFSAQMLGATSQPRGLKGGAPVLQAARRAYLERAWSGRGDRRAVRGTLAVTRI